MSPLSPQFMIFFFFFNDTATTEIYTLSLHDALPICMTETSPIGVVSKLLPRHDALSGEELVKVKLKQGRGDRKSTRLNSSHTVISYAVFCLKKKKHPSERQKNRAVACPAPPHERPAV